MPKFRVVTPKGASFTVAGGGYDYEKEALDPIGAEIIEAPANEAEFIAAAKTADAIYAKGMPITKTVIDALENCKVITLGSVGVDSVDVKAATARGIPVTNIPDTFIEEVADHAMMLLLAGFRRLVEQDKMVRTGRWSEGRPALLKMPRLMGQTLGFISFGRVARAVAKRAAPFGLAHDRLRSLHPGNADFRSRRGPGDAVGSAGAVRFPVDARAGAARGPSHAGREALQANEEEPRSSSIPAVAQRWTRKRWSRRCRKAGSRTLRLTCWKRNRRPTTTRYYRWRMSR